MLLVVSGFPFVVCVVWCAVGAAVETVNVNREPESCLNLKFKPVVDDFSKRGLGVIFQCCYSSSPFRSLLQLGTLCIDNIRAIKSVQGEIQARMIESYDSTMRTVVDGNFWQSCGRMHAMLM